MKSCDDCTYKLKEKAKNKYNRPNIYCTKRKCVVPRADEAAWCDFYNKEEGDIKEEDTKCGIFKRADLKSSNPTISI